MANWVWNQLSVRFPTREARDDFARRADGGNQSIRQLFTGEPDPEHLPEPMEGALYLFDIRLIGMTGERLATIEFDTKWGAAHIGSIPEQLLGDLRLLHRYDSVESSFRGFSSYSCGTELESYGVWNRVFSLPGMPDVCSYLQVSHLEYLQRATAYLKTLTAEDLTVLMVSRVGGLIEALPVTEDFREVHLEDGDTLYRRLDALIMDVAKEVLRGGTSAAASKALLQMEKDVESNIRAKGEGHEPRQRPPAYRRRLGRHRRR